VAKKCSHEDSRLTCIDCSTPICSNCMVQCPVGFRCKSCGTAGSPQKKSTAVGGVKLFGLSALVGAGGGWGMSFFSIPFINCILYFFVGLIAGRWLAQFIDYQLRDRSGRIIVLGTLLGMCFSPLAAVPFTALGVLTIAFTTSPQTIFSGFAGIVGMLFTPTIFLVGILRSTVWGGY
jgi:hypothetical protein